ncbi:MAG: M1 family metallopeptidase [Gemmatimonadota bacterium]
MGRPDRAGRYDPETTILHYDVELVIPPENDRVSARTEIRYLRDRGGPHELALDFTGMTVEAVMWRGSPLEFTHEEGVVRFESPGSPGRYDTLRVEIMTRGVPDDGLILRENVHGEPTAFADNWPNRARFWFPSMDHPAHRATVGFTVHAPPDRVVIANGLLQGEPERVDSLGVAGMHDLFTWRWESEVAIPTYLMVVGAAQLAEMPGGLAACGAAPASPRDDGCIEVTAWAFPPDTAHAREVFGRAAEMVDLYTEVFGPYPYEKLANVQASTRFGGMENASTIFYAESGIAEGRDIEATVAHEIAHQWFGNSVTPADWPHLWLSEGFASYFGPHFWERTEGLRAFRERIDGVRERYLTSDVTERPILDHQAENLLDRLNANSYQKGALVLHMLRWVMGDQAFFRGVRRYYETHRGGNADTDDLRRVMEESHGEGLDWFFEQWVERPGYPVYRLDWAWMASAGEARVTLFQEQDVLWPTFRMPIELEFQMEGGVHRVIQWVDGREFTARVPLPGEPRELRVDPDGWLLMQLVE